VSYKPLSGKWHTDPATRTATLEGCARRPRSPLLPHTRIGLEERTASAERQLATLQELLTASTARATDAELALAATSRDPDGARVREANRRYAQTIAELRARIRIALDHLQRHDERAAVGVLTVAVDDSAV
jgi:hypothetical protein